MVLPPLIPSAINHLLAQESWARDRLAAHVGKVACVNVSVMRLKLKVAADGLVESAAADEPANVTILVNPADLLLIAQNREHAFSYVKIEGDADFANTLSQLSQSLHWEVEEDLSKWVGDVAATRIVAGAHAVWETARTTQQNLAENVAEYFLEEQPMLVRPQAVSDFGGEVRRLQDDIERLTKRIEKLEKAKWF